MDTRASCYVSRDFRHGRNSNSGSGMCLADVSEPSTIVQQQIYGGNFDRLTRNTDQTPAHSTQVHPASRFQRYQTDPESVWKDFPAQYSSNLGNKSTGSLGGNHSSLKRIQDCHQSYIDPELVKGVLDFQNDMQRSIKSALNYNEIPGRDVNPSSRKGSGTNKHKSDNVVIGRRVEGLTNRTEAPLSNRNRFVESSRVETDPGQWKTMSFLASVKIDDPEVVSLGSHRESGYHSCDTDSDNPSEGRRTLPRRDTISSLPLDPSPERRCEYYFMKGETFLETFDEMEQRRRIEEASESINLAIECFERALRIPDASTDTILRIRTKYNTALLRRRRFLKQKGLETPDPDHSGPPDPDHSTVPRWRRLHLVSQSENDKSGIVNRGAATPTREIHRFCRGVLQTPDCHSRPTGDLERYEFKQTKDPIIEPVRSVSYCQYRGSDMQHPHKIRGRQNWSKREINNVGVYGTLPKQSPKFATGLSLHGRPSLDVDQSGSSTGCTTKPRSDVTCLSRHDGEPGHSMQVGYTTQPRQSSDVACPSSHGPQQYDNDYSHPFMSAACSSDKFVDHSSQRINHDNVPHRFDHDNVPHRFDLDNVSYRFDLDLYSRKSSGNSLRLPPACSSMKTTDGCGNERLDVNDGAWKDGDPCVDHFMELKNRPRIEIALQN